MLPILFDLALAVLLAAPLGQEPNGGAIGLAVADYSVALDIGSFAGGQLPPGVSTGAVRLASADAAAPDGPWVHFQRNKRVGTRVIELDLTVSNGEMNGPRTPHIHAPWLDLVVPNHWAVVPRFDWIDVQATSSNSYRVDLGCNVYQGVLLCVPLALVPKGLVDAAGNLAPAIAQQFEMLPWLGTGPGFLDGLPRFAADPSQASSITFKANGLPKGEADYLVADYGALAGGQSIRFDFGAELGWLAPADLYHRMQRWSYEVHRRPQRCYLTFDGLPLTPEQAPVGFKLWIGPSELMLSNFGTNSFGFDELWIYQNPNLLLGSIDLQHAPRWFGPDAYLAQVFGDAEAIQRIRWMAAMARLNSDELHNIAPGNLNRGIAWNAVLQALSVHLSSDPAASLWLQEFIEICERDQSVHGGMCAWLWNKEATVYAPQYTSQVTGIPIQDVPIVPVTQPYQETILAYALHCAKNVGIESATKPEMLGDLIAFICGACRTPGVAYCWYRTGIDGAQLSFDKDPYYYPGALALAIQHGIDGHASWLADYLAGQPIIWGAPAGPNFDNWRNRWQLKALVP